jgi:hypothetical protein
MFGGIFYGAMYGGSTTSILVNTPGESSSVVTAIDGFQDGEEGARGRGAGDGGDWLVFRRHLRHVDADAAGAGASAFCACSSARRSTLR